MHYAKTKRRRKTSSTAVSPGHAASSDALHGGAMQGEGNYDAAREFNAAEQKFVQSGKVAAAARAAAPRSDAEREEMLEAEARAKSRAKEDYPPPPEARPPGGSAPRSEPSKDAPRRRR